MSTDDPRVSEAELLAEEYEPEHESEVAEFDLDQFMAQARAAYEMLNQDTHWIDVRGRIHRLADMSVRYKANCLAYMRKPGRVKWFADRYMWGELSSLSLPSGWREINSQGEELYGNGRSVSRGEMLGLGDFGNMDAAHDEYVEALQQRIKADPERWLDETPLMQALSAQVLAGEGGAVGNRPEDEPRTVPGLETCPTCSRAAAGHRRSGPLRRLCTGEWVIPV